MLSSFSVLTRIVFFNHYIISALYLRLLFLLLFLCTLLQLYTQHLFLLIIPLSTLLNLLHSTLHILSILYSPCIYTLSPFFLLSLPHPYTPISSFFSAFFLSPSMSPIHPHLPISLQPTFPSPLLSTQLFPIDRFYKRLKI